MTSTQSIADLDQLSVFFLGATGYIGGSILAGYRQRYPNFLYTALVRSVKDIPAVEALGVRVIQGSNEDVELVEKISSGHDIVVNCANADDLPLATAVIKGLFTKAKGNPSGRRPILIQTSGTGVVTDAADGSFHPGISDKIYDDNVVEDIKSIDPKQPHRNVDLQVFAAGETGQIDTYIIAPSTIYGKGRGPVRNISQQVNGMIRIAVEKKELLYIGAGTNIWNNVHIDDLIELYGLVLDLALSGDNTNKSYANFFWGSASEHVWGQVAEELAKLLHQRGLVKSDKANSVPVSEAPKQLYYTANNSRTVANRSFALGWKPTGKSLFDTLPEEIDLTLSQL